MTQHVGKGSGLDKGVLLFAPDTDRSYRQILLIISPPGTISDAMAAAVEREFDWISVRHVSEAKSADAEFDAQVQLILVDQAIVDAETGALAHICDAHPTAATAVIATSQSRGVDDLIQVIESYDVRGILPMDVNLDIWLSIVRILLKGGRYFPPVLFRGLQRNGAADIPAPSEHRQSPLNAFEQWSVVMHDLTERELEVLAMVARGHQNKNIAFELGLSEHTVKIHMHNIIRKLGVHNRTEAAAKYFEHTNHRENHGEQDEHNAKNGGGTPSDI